MIDAGALGCDVALSRSAPPTPTATTALGLISDYVQAAVAKARVVIAEVNEQVPYTRGELLHRSKIDCAVHVSRSSGGGPVGSDR